MKAGFYEVAQTGSHVKFAKPVAKGFVTTTVPKHREVASGTLRSILRQAFLTESEFEKL
ncbi:MAG: type II toxin-antitoxin system HicA family toxin [Acidobacteria bacterium]|nr:type II toxin-antitoxin system HicA family toxin [Acidobacteriota bacterium]